MSNVVGQNPVGAQAGNTLARPFVCEVSAPVGGGDVTMTRADILTALSGATFSGTGLSATDPSYACVSSYDISLVNLGDESESGVTTTCQAVVTDTQTGKTKDMEPGGNYSQSVDVGRAAPDFSLVIAEGSGVVICGGITATLDKRGNPITKPDAPPQVDRPRLQLEKTADTSALTDPPQVGQVITYRMTVRNTGNVPLTNVTVTDDNAVVSGSIASLAVGQSDSTTITATHSITQSDLDAEQVVNTATATGTDPAGTQVTDISDDPTDSATSGAAGNDPTVVPLVTPTMLVCYESCEYIPGAGSAQYIRRAGLGVVNPDGADSAAPGGPFFNRPDSDGVPSFQPSQAWSTLTVGPGDGGGHFNDLSDGTTNDWFEATAFLAIPPAACLGDGSATEILLSSHNWGDAHQSVFAAAGWDRTALEEIGRSSEDSFEAVGSQPILPSSPHWTGPAPQDGTITLPLSSAITAATIHTNSVDERQASDNWWRYSLDGGVTWEEMPRTWFYASAADAATASDSVESWVCDGETCTGASGATSTVSAVVASGGVEVNCP